MQVRYFALIFGIVYALVGVLGFFPGFLQPLDPAAPEVAVESLNGLLLGIFPVNILHTIVHLVVGLAGIWAFFSYRGSVIYAKTLAVLFGILAVMGLIPGLWTTFGLIPLFGNDVWLHAATALIAAYFGFFAPRPAETTATATTVDHVRDRDRDRDADVIVTHDR